MLYLHRDLVKGESTGDDGGGHQTGEQRGGNYVARIQTGYEKDGSPKYRYFKTAEEHREYLESKNKPSEKGKKKEKDGDGHLKEKLDKEHKESSRKTKQGPNRTSLFVRDKSSREANKKVKKSFDLFIWRLD